MLCVLATWGMLLFSVYVVAFVLLRPTPFEQCLSASKVLTSLAFATLAGELSWSGTKASCDFSGGVWLCPVWCAAGLVASDLPARMAMKACKHPLKHSAYAHTYTRVSRMY